MDARVTKLKHKLNCDTELATALVEAGLDTPRKIKAAKESDIEKKLGKTRADIVKEKIK